MTNQEYILEHREEDIRSLALKPTPEGIDKTWCLTQIEGYQLAKKKLPRWAATEGLIYPPRLSMEQCSSEMTAEYKAGIVKRLGGNSLIDLTGGFGVDFSYMAKECEHVIYVERQEVLREAARNNFPLLGLPHAEVWNKDAEEALVQVEHVDIINIDPARRDDCGRKVAAIEDCTPNLIELQDRLLEKADYVIVKLSPMLDITQAMRVLHNVMEVHVVSVKNECKELLFVLSNKANTLTYYCINLSTNEVPFITMTRDSAVTLSMPGAGMLLIEPNSSIMKAGLQDAFAVHYGLKKLHPMSHLYLTKTLTLTDIPGRVFRIKELGNARKTDIKQANLTVRNFPSTVAALRKRLKIKEGGNEYLFATTLMDNSHVLIRCEKLSLQLCWLSQSAATERTSNLQPITSNL